MVLKTAAPLFTFRNDDGSSDFPQKSLLELTDEICNSFKEIIRRDPGHISELKVFLQNIVIANIYCIYNGAEYELVKEHDSINPQTFPNIRNQVKDIVMSDELKKIIDSTAALDFNTDECEKELDLFINANDSERRKMLVEKQNATNKFIAKHNIEPEYNDLYKVLNKIYKHIYKHRLKYKVAAAAVLLTLCILCPATTPSLNALASNNWVELVSIGLTLMKITKDSDFNIKPVLSLFVQDIINFSKEHIFKNVSDSEEEDKNELPIHVINHIWQEIQKITKDYKYLPGHLECRESNVTLPELSSEAPRARVGNHL